MTFHLLKKDLCLFYHISDYIEYFHCPGHFVCVGNSRKVKHNPCPQCAYIWCVFLCVCVCVCYTYVCACISMPEGVCVCVSVCVCLCICLEHNWGTLWLAALRNTVHRGSLCWQERIWKSYTDKPAFVLGLDRKGASVSRNRGEGIFEEKNTWEKAEGGDCSRHVPCAHVSREEELNGKARPR